MPARQRATSLVALCLALSVVLFSPKGAFGSSAIAVTWDNLLRGSTSVAVVTPGQATASWENGRIYTYTPVRVDRLISGDLVAGAQVRIRTMGGVVGKVGQIVEGEALLQPGRPSLLFVHPVAGSSAFDVTARGQGQFPIVSADPNQPPRLVRNEAVGLLLAPDVRPPAVAPPLAAEVLHGRALEDAVREVTTAWERTHQR